MSNASPQPITIAIVNANSSDYDELLSVTDSSNVSVCFLSKGSDALRLVRRWDIDLWIVNAALADMSGFDLAQLLRRSRRGARIFLIDDEYRVDNELRALSQGMTKYLCKPLDPAWIFGWALPRLAPAMAFVPASAPLTLPLAESMVGDRESESPAGSPHDVPVILPFIPRPSRRPAA